MAVRVLALCAGRPLPPGTFVVLISVRGWLETRAIVRSIDKSDNMANRTSDLPACSTVPQPTTRSFFNWVSSETHIFHTYVNINMYICDYSRNLNIL
jgi:hypothetical protein